MNFKKTINGKIDFRYLLQHCKPISEFNLKKMTFQLSDERSDDDGSENLPVSCDDVWQSMLRMVLGYVPERAKHAPPCYCELIPITEKHNFSGLAGLPPAVRLMDGFFPVRDQNKRGACFAFALVALCEYMLGKTVELSEQSLFHFTKMVTPGKVDDLGDGAIILDSIHAVEEFGICPLSEWHYNPESWNYVEDPYNEGQGRALQRKLELAQPYRFHNWRTLSQGYVLQFKQMLSAGFPIYTGVLVTTDWDNDEVRKTGVIPFPKLVWKLRVYLPPRGLIEKKIEEMDIDLEGEEADVVAKQIVFNSIDETISYIGDAVFGCSLSLYDAKEEEDYIEFVFALEKICGGHALCLAGYVDDESYPGGGYFIARNSWSDDKWAPDSPEMPGYALLPYAYVADFADVGVVMSEFPNQGRVVGTSSTSDASIPYSVMNGSIKSSTVFNGGMAQASTERFSGCINPKAFSISSASSLSSCHIKQSVPTTFSTNDGFEAWLAERKLVLSRPKRDASGVLLRPGTQIFVLDPAQPDNVLCDTPKNRAKLFEEFERERYEKLVKTIMGKIDSLLPENYNCILIDDIREALEKTGIYIEKSELRSIVLTIQERHPERYALCLNNYGNEEVEEVRPTKFIGKCIRVNK